MYKISVVVPVYNTEKFLDRCLLSLENQTVEDLEVVIVNDGSTDNSQSIIDKYVKKNPKRFKTFLKENQGPAATRNFGIEKANGEYIGFVDSDDWVDINMYKYLLENIEQNNADIAVCDYYKVVGESKEIKKMDEEFIFPTRLIEQPKLLNNLIPSPCNKLYKKSLFSDELMFPHFKYEDFGLIPKLLFEAKKISKVNMPLYFYVDNIQGETNTVNTKIFDIFNIFDELIMYFNSKDISNDFLMELEYLMISKVFDYNIRALRLKDRKDTIKFIHRSYDFLNRNFNNWKNNYYFNDEKKSIRRYIHNFLIKNKSAFMLYHFYLKK